MPNGQISTTHISATTQSAPNPGLDAQFIDNILSGQQSTRFQYPYYIPITTLPLFGLFIQVVIIRFTRNKYQ